MSVNYPVVEVISQVLEAAGQMVILAKVKLKWKMTFILFYISRKSQKSILDVYY